MEAQVTESAKMYEFLAWLELNRKRIITVASILAAVFLVIYYFRYHQHQREVAASHALLKLGAPIARDEQAPPTAAAYLKVAEQFEGTQASKRARVLAAGAYYSENSYSAALEQFKKILESNRGTSMGGIAAVGVASCLDAQDKVDDALKAYQEVVAQYSGEPVSGQARLAMARIYESRKQPEAALKLYDEITRLDAQGSAFKGDAAQRREALLRQYPQLVPTNAPAASLSATTPASTNLNRTASTNRPSTNQPGANK
jgi:predicted negative regulator of RcsB-dependent stress response